MLGVTVAAALAALGTLWIYVRRERLGTAGVGLAALRTAAIALLAGLLANPVRTLRDTDRPPVVLLDASLSMQAAGGPWAAARDSARRVAGTRGTILRFGGDATPDDTTPPAFPASRLVPALAAAAGLGGPVTVITDGVITDAASIPPALRAIATTMVLPRDTLGDVAVVDARLRDRIGEDDTLAIELALRRWPPAPDSAPVEVFVGARRVGVAVATFGGGATATATLAIPARALGAGAHALRIVARTGDAEPRTDERYRIVEVSPLPAVTLVAVPAGWEARFLARELADIVRAPVGAYGQLTPERWVDMATLQTVPAARVAAAERSARLAVRLGGAAVALPVPTWAWPSDDVRRLAGEWYPGAPPSSPLAGRLSGVAWDSLPPLTGVLPVTPPPDAWTGLAARLARRGAERPLLVGYDSAGTRRLVMAADGLWRWALRGGAAREAYRAVVAAGVEWLLGARALSDAPLLVEQPVVGRGEPVVFRWAGGGEAPEAVPLRLLRVAGVAVDTVDALLGLNAQGEGRVELPVGFWQWRSTQPSASGLVAVEPYATEFVPAPVTVTAEPAQAAAGTRTAGLRDWWWLYLLVVGLLLGEWGWRMRRGLP